VPQAAPSSEHHRQGAPDRTLAEWPRHSPLNRPRMPINFFHEQE
jgi:hypothetical protein